jgi:osmotically inducible protein OsmC
MTTSHSQTITAEVASTRGREGVVESSDTALRCDLGAEHAPTPEHYFAAAYAACFHSALLKAARTAHVELPGSSIIARVGLADEEGGDTAHLTVELRAALPGVDEEQARKLLQQAHATCPYSRALRGNVDVKIVTD